jgi:hypothetical protein
MPFLFQRKASVGKKGPPDRLAIAAVDTRLLHPPRNLLRRQRSQSHTFQNVSRCQSSFEYATNWEAEP